MVGARWVVEERIVDRVEEKSVSIRRREGGDRIKNMRCRIWITR